MYIGLYLHGNVGKVVDNVGLMWESGEDKFHCLLIHIGV